MIRRTTSVRYTNHAMTKHWQKHLCLAKQEAEWFHSGFECACRYMYDAYAKCLYVISSSSKFLWFTVYTYVYVYSTFNNQPNEWNETWRSEMLYVAVVALNTTAHSDILYCNCVSIMKLLFWCFFLYLSISSSIPHFHFFFSNCFPTRNSFAAISEKILSAYFMCIYQFNVYGKIYIENDKQRFDFYHRQVKLTCVYRLNVLHSYWLFEYPFASL